MGLLSLTDPPRPDSKDMIAGARELGVKPLMLTGDNIAIAREMVIRLIPVIENLFSTQSLT